MRVIAVDWSGSNRQAHRKIWLAEVAGDQQLVDLRNGWSRESLTEHLIAEAARDPKMIVGLDFAFSFPEWFVRRQGYRTVRDVWASCQQHGETWLETCADPFGDDPAGSAPLTTMLGQRSGAPRMRSHA